MKAAVLYQAGTPLEVKEIPSPVLRASSVRVRVTATPILSFTHLVMGAALARLNAQDRACLLLRVVQGFSAAEVGQIVDATPDAVTKRLSRAKQRLRTLYLAHEAPSQEER